MIIANTDRKKLKYINYDYDPKNPNSQIQLIQITQPSMNFVELRDHGCKPEDNGSVFKFRITPTNALMKIFATYDEQAIKEQNDRKQKAPAPKF